ncbi:MAG: putative sugar O-methyltransferase [Chlamydiales bacterium]|nr:putative sugar O-methyltransferase [Chlamydiales bacterium]
MFNRSLAALVLSSFFTLLSAGESITGADRIYRETCLKAVQDGYVFQNFRSLSDYAHVLEVGAGGDFATHLLQNGSKEVLEKMPAFQRLEEFGNPAVNFYPGIGSFSGTTLRYIAIADQMQKFFSLPENATAVEIGGGFGGQCFILSQLQKFSSYYIYDLPEVTPLVEKMMRSLSVSHVICMPIQANINEEKIDLFISNYAFSECDRQTQLDYFERVIKKADRGYLIYNQIAERVYRLDSLSPAEFINLLRKNGVQARIYSEPVLTDVDNLVIIWDKTR